jgi:hypothetical protein
MLVKTNHSVPLHLLMTAKEEFNFTDFRTSINKPTGNFFYDPWVIKDEFKNTVWEKLLDSLPYQVGEARLINLEMGKCYQSHSDIDDRYHLNIQGDISYLVNLDTETMYRITNDGFWYDLDAGPRHSAVNMGVEYRIQLVVRKLLLKNNVANATDITIKSSMSNSNRIRFLFDDQLSGILNKYNKNSIINNFSPATDGLSVSMTIDSNYIDELQSLLPSNFYIESK